MKSIQLLIDKNIHSVLTVCPQCGSNGVNTPLNNKCANCGHLDCLTYYDSENIDKYLMPKKKHGGKRDGAGRKPKEPTVVRRIPVSVLAKVDKIIAEKK